MRKFPIFAAILAVLTLLGVAPGRAADQTPQAFLEKLYAAYVGPNRSGLMVDSDKVLARYLTPEVIALMDKMYAASKKSGDVPALDGDPFVDGQEWDIKKFDIAVDQPAGDKATGHVSFKNYDEQKSITLDLVHLKSGWRIDDIHWSDGSFRELLIKGETQ